ncbi:neutral zinc metallopeptidase [Aquihabitans sp. G128]|uniref:neutral zinc metallopeptidase n=1 Tax=Aquihabitans sp. G128 TaxID=2849779 RepID=UPI001C24148A|nr:neutral zinc metallopeptidase [Aquihabitans sp. G128]QXC63357.1 neutral zinc metallopeptidase [Aquihabitans sp. G128]
MEATPSLRRRTAIVVVAIAALLASCGVDVSSDGGAPKTGGKGDGGVIGSDITPTTEAAPTTTTPPPTDIDVANDDGSELNKVAVNAIADLQDFWGTEFPKVFDGDEYQPVSGGFFAVDSSSDPKTLPCSPPDLDQVLYNAYYCPTDDAVAWDQEGLFPDLSKQFGDFTIAVVLAHEWGHAIQARAKIEEPTVVLELQADCFAGAWVKHVSDGEGRFSVTTEDLDNALAGILSLRDAPGSKADDPNAHGSGFDRVGAFQDGFEESASRCAEYTDGDPAPYQFPFTTQDDLDNAGNLPFSASTDSDGNEVEGIDTLAFESLELYWKDEFPKISDGKDWTPLKAAKAFSPSDPPSCNGETVDQFRLFYCVPDHYVGFDAEETLPEAYKLGDFAVGALFGTQYGLAVEDELGSQPDSERTATLQADCYTGAWAGALLPTAETNQGEELPFGLILSPGDLDEAVTVLLTFRTDSDRERQGPGFERVKAFRAGVVRGADTCGEVKASS